MSQTIAPSAAPAQAETAVAKASKRLYFADHLRAVLAVLVVLHHVALVYGASAPFYYVEPPFNDSTAFTTLLVFVLVNQAWFMGAFFLLAGYFTPGSFDRKGARAFLRERLIRLGIPLVVYMLLLNPLAELGGYLMPASLTGVTDPPTLDIYPRLIGLGPLWFVAMLLIFNLGYMLWRGLVKNRTFDPGRASWQPGIVSIGIFMLALAGASFLMRMIVPLGQSVNVIGDFFSFPTIAYLPQYLSFFVLGMIAARHDWLRTLPNALGWVGGLVAIIAAVLLFPLAISGEMFTVTITPALDNAMGSGHWQSAVYTLWDSIFSVGLFLALIILFRRFFNAKNAFGSFLSRNSYAVYILHIPIVVYLAYALRGIDLTNLPKAIVAGVIIVPACFIAAYLIRKIPGVSRVL